MEDVRFSADIPIAIIGMGCRLPDADNLEQYWDLLIEGRSAVVELPPDRLDADLYYDAKVGARGKTYSKLGAVVSNREVDRSVCPLPAELAGSVDIVHRVMCDTAAAAFRHAQLDPFDLPLRNAGVYIGHAQGSGLGGALTYATCIEEAAHFLREGEGFAALPPHQQDEIIDELIERVRSQLPSPAADNPDVSCSMVAGVISKAFGLTGPFLAINSACASSLQAMLLAARALQLGRIEMAVAGGASDCKSDTLVLFAHAQAMSATGSRPFDTSADGLIVGEGYVALVMKTLQRALADGDPIQAVVRGLGVSSDGKGKSLWAPLKEGQLKAMERAYRGSVELAGLQYIEAHATATQLGDATELNTLTEILSEHLPPGKKVPVTSVKANIGHTLEVAGIAGVIKAVLCMQHGMVAPAINVTERNPKIDWDKAPIYIPTSPTPWPAPSDGSPRRAGVNAFGIGGLNMHVVLDDFNDRTHRLVDAGPQPHALISRSSADDDAIAVIGMGCVFPGAGSVPAYWDLLVSGRNPKCDAPANRWRSDLAFDPGSRRPFHSGAVRGGFITDFQYDWRQHKVPPKQIAQADPLQFMLLDAADQAMVDAGYDKRPFDRSAVSVLVGTEFGGDFAFQLQMGLRLPPLQRLITELLGRRGLSAERTESIAQQFAETLLSHWPSLIDETGSFSTSSLASRISKTWNLAGGAAAIDCGSASALAAVAVSIDMLLAGDCDMMICAAGQRRLALPEYEALSMAGLLSSEDPPRSVFDEACEGFLPGEGVGVILLKRLASARRDGDRIRAIIRGVSAGHGTSSGTALQMAMDRSFQLARIAPADVAVMEFGGGGPPDVNVEQFAAIAAVHGRSSRREPLALSAVMGQIGHTEGASGMASLIKAILEVDRGEVPATAGFDRPAQVLADHAAILRPVAQRSPIQVVSAEGRRTAGVSACSRSLAYHVVVERGEKVPVADQQSTGTEAFVTQAVPAAPLPARAATLTPWHICRFGAPSLDQLQAELVTALEHQASGFDEARRRPFGSADAVRMAIVADTPETFGHKLSIARKQAGNAASQSLLDKQGIFCRQLRQTAPRIAFVFSGQGSQYQGMLRQLVREDPAAAEAMQAADEILGRHAYGSFSALAWTDPSPLGTDVWATQAAMLLADSIVYAAVMNRQIRPALVLGHSYGEYAALFAAGAWDLETALVVTRARCDGIQRCSTGRGRLLATTAEPDVVARIGARLVGEVFVANHNAPDQTVVGGSIEALQQLAELLRAESYQTRQLAVPCPFHTPLMRDAAAPLRQALLTAEIRAPQVPMVSVVTNRPVHTPDEIRANLIAHLTTPVRYVDLIRSIADECETVFVEIGPGQILTRLHERILDGHDAVWIATDHVKRPGCEQIDSVQALLECTGALDPPRTPAAAITRISTRYTEIPQPMSPGKYPSPGKHPILRFDATARRREKMRQNATSSVVPGRPAPPAAPPNSIATADTRATQQAVAQRSSFASEQPLPSAPANAEISAVPATAELEKFLIHFVVEQTGYPPEVVELDADLEADLGIDSIKKAQLFGELQEYFDVTPSDDLTLDDFPTLRHVLNFLAGIPTRTNLGRDATAETIEPQPAVSAPVPVPSRSTTPAQPSPVAAASVAEPGGTELETFLINFVVEQTGYPPEVVELDADLEADLGIDSIKKAQLFGELQEYFDVTPSDDLTLDDFPTLRHVLNFLAGVPSRTDLGRRVDDETVERLPAASAPAADPPPPLSTEQTQPLAATSVARSGDAELETFLINFVVEQTGYPPEVVELDADLEADLGIDSIKKAQLFGELQEYFDVTPSDDLTLDDFPTLRHVVNFLAGVAQSSPAPEPVGSTTVAAAPGAPTAATVSTHPRTGFAAAPRESDVATLPDDIRLVRLRGTPYEMGYAHGLQLKEEILRALRGIADRVDIAWDELPLSREGLDDPGRCFDTEQLSELQGVADAVGVPLGNIVAYNLALFADMGSGSTRFAIPAGRNPARCTVHFAEEELPLASSLSASLVPTVQVREPAAGIAHVALSFAGVLGALGGVNACGLAITGGVLVDRRSNWSKGPLHPLVVRTVLQESHDLDRAVDRLRAVASGSAWNACVTYHPSDRACYVEHDGQAIKVLAGDDIVAASNHCLLHCSSDEVPAASQRRLDVLQAVRAAAITMGLTVEGARELLSASPFVVTPSIEKAGAALHASRTEDRLGIVIGSSNGDTWIQYGHLKQGGFTSGSALSLRELLPVVPQPTAQPRRVAAEDSGVKYDLDDSREPFAHRFVMRVVPAPWPPNTAESVPLNGPALVVGDNPEADALRARLAATGASVVALAVTGDLQRDLESFEQLWRRQPIHHLFLAMGRDEEAMHVQDDARFHRRYQAAVLWPFFLCQRWVTLAGQADLLNKATLVALTNLGGDVGFSGKVAAPEGGALTGLMKAIYFEIGIMRRQSNFRAKAIDAPVEEPPEQLADNVLRELASGAIDYELAFVEGKRYLQRAEPARADVQPLAHIRHGATWVVTGGARGITAECAFELGRRFGLDLHLVGTSPPPEIDPAWRDLSEPETRSLRSETFAKARQAGQSPPEAWLRVQKAIEIDRSLRRFAEAGLQVTYHVCDVSDRDAVEQLLDRVRQQSGPIEGVLHGAGIDCSCRLEKKDRANVLATVGSKVAGAYHLMTLTEIDPVRHFVGFGSISGRFGSNGQTDYCLASDMLCKLVSWYRHRNPDCHAVALHYHAWDEVGMAFRPETKVARRMRGAPDSMPKREGVEHLLRELYTGSSSTEVLITNWDYFLRFYPDPRKNTSVGTEQAEEAGHPAPTSSQDEQPGPGIGRDRLAQRFVMRTFEAPLPAAREAILQLDGPAYILGRNSTALALKRRLESLGTTVHLLPDCDDTQTAIAALEAVWAMEPACNLFLMAARDAEASRLLSKQDWHRRRMRGVLIPFRITQHWCKLRSATPTPGKPTLVAVTSLGGDFGFVRQPSAPEGGAITGLLKSLHIEGVRNEMNRLRVKVIDASADEPPEAVAEAVCRELAAGQPQIEVSLIGGRRHIVRSVRQPVESLPRSDLKPGGTWVVTGGARGVTAAVALELGRRYRLKLHLIGKSPVPTLDAHWRNASEQQLQAVKKEIVRRAVAAGRSPEEDWLAVKHDMEIFQSLHAFEQAGVEATYYSCDMADWDAVDRVLQQIRQADGPIDAIVHGAGYARSSRFDTKVPEKIERTFAKLDGAVALMALTRHDPVRYFIGFGSISGRFGGNGLTDYAAANDMLCKLTDWYRFQRPACAATSFHWISWDDVGMAMIPDNQLGAKNVLKMDFMPLAEGIEHLHQEMRGGLPEGEVLIDDGHFQRTFYPDEAPAEASPASSKGEARPAATNRPLIHAVSPRDSTGTMVADVLFDPVADPFLKEHRLKGKPFLPGVIGIEALLEAASVAAGGRSIGALRDVVIPNGLLFHSNKPIKTVVTLAPIDNGWSCRLTSELRDRRGRLVQADRLHVTGVVEWAAGTDVIRATPPGQPPLGWFPHQYADDGPIYHGQPFRCLKQCAFQYDGGWGQIVAGSAAELAGGRSHEGWILPSAVLDACLVTCGGFVFLQFGGQVEVPHGFDRLRWTRLPSAGETCVVRLAFLGRERPYSRFDFTLFGADQEPILQVDGYRTIEVVSSNS